MACFDQHARERHSTLVLFIQLEERNAYQFVPGCPKDWIGPVIRTSSSVTVLDRRTLGMLYRIDGDGRQHTMTEYQNPPAPPLPPVPKVSYVLMPANHPLKWKAAGISTRFVAIWELAQEALKEVYP